MLRKVSVRLLAPLLLGVPVIVTAMVLLIVGLMQSSKTIRSLTFQEMSQIDGRVRERLDGLLEIPQRVSRVNAELVRTGVIDLSAVRGLRPMLHNEVQAFSELSGTTVAAADGDVAWMFRYPGKEGYEFGIRDRQTGDEIVEYAVDAQGEITNEVGRYTYDPRQRPWFTGALASSEATYLEPYGWVNEDGSVVALGLPFVQAVRDEAGEVIAVLSTEISLADLSSFLRTIRIGDNGFILILDEEGTLIANSVGAPVATPTEPEAKAIASVDPRIAGAARAAVGKGNEEFTAEVDGQVMLLHSSMYSGVSSLKWRVVTAAPEAELMAPVREAREGAWQVIGVAVLLTTLVGIGIGVLVAHPIASLSKDVRRVGEGSLDHHVERGPTVELSALADEINAMTSGLRERQRLQDSLELAMQVQQNLLPDGPPAIEGLQIVGESVYCDETGGDYFDYLPMASGRGAAVVIGDVTGHGIAAAMLMATARGILRSRWGSGTLTDVITHLNDRLSADTDDSRFMTLLLIEVDPETRQMGWVSAGHGPPLVFDPTTGGFLEIGDGDIPLGVIDGFGFSEPQTFELNAGHVVLLATDGLWEARSVSGEMYGMDRVAASIAAVADEDAATIERRILSDHSAFCEGEPADDDLTMVVLRLEG